MNSQEAMMVSRPMVQVQVKVCPFRSQKCLGDSCAIWDDEFQCCSLKNGTDVEEEDVGSVQGE